MSSLNNVERFRKIIRDGQICVGTSVQIADPIASELAAEAGNDFVWFEMEHTYTDISHLGFA